MVGGIFCDQEKAFGSVSYDILLCILNFYGVRGPFHNLIKSCITNRFWRFLIGIKSCYHSNYLEWSKIYHGVPQGSILGPLLFLFYENDLPKIVQYNSKPTLFADDTSLIFSNPNYLDFKTTINNVFSQLNKWFNDDLYFQIKKNLNMSILLSKVLYFMKHQLAIIAVSFQILLVLSSLE